MEAIGEGVATPVAESLVDKAMKELKYLCCYKTYVDDFEEEKTSLSARRNRVLKDIEDAKHRNENKVEDEVELWLDRAKDLIEEDTKGKKKWFGLVTNCFWQYKRGKELEGKTQKIKRLMGQSNFARVARSTGLPGMDFYSCPNFMTFEDRELISQKLKEALKDDNRFMIGLYGLGGTGKTTMAIEVGKDVEESKLFDKVIFSVVSKDANLKNIRVNIAKHLDLPLTEGMEESEQAQKLWKTIAEGGKKVLIILDDMWEKLTLRDIGIPLGRHGKGCCAVLLTTRDRRVCIDMDCNEPSQLEVLKEKDAVDLFLSYAGMSIDGPSNDFKDVARDIVKECGSLPIAIVAVASALKSRPLPEWRDSLKRLQNHERIHDVDKELKQAYNSLRLSYAYLRNEKAKQLFLLCSLFPEDYEIPIELLTRIAIGVGLCGEANIYSVARSHFTPIKNELIDSCLLLKDKNECVKMHDLVREVALWIGNKQVQAGMNSNSTLMENIHYSSWNLVDFPNHFDGKKLEVLLLWIHDANSPRVKVPNAIFEGMENLKILALMSSSDLEISAASLF
ncbi:probable disease resistance protein At4g27220 [Neltuma alba]|uniref:probable disease resistance protein At4g27220 n=1 Tax=Neltuma alba TaxID=207710 RepID=UPI0010A416EB|nr:probable disease resistance protein At4g27220 [Prosopis alba]